MNETIVSSIVDRAVEIATGSSDMPSTPSQLLTPPSSPFVQMRSSSSKSLISYHHLAKALTSSNGPRSPTGFSINPGSDSSTRNSSGLSGNMNCCEYNTCYQHHKPVRCITVETVK